MKAGLLDVHRERLFMIIDVHNNVEQLVRVFDGYIRCIRLSKGFVAFDSLGNL